MGHIVSAFGVRADPQKIEVMVRWPPPQTTKQLWGFLDLTGYYRQFIRGYASLAAPFLTYYVMPSSGRKQQSKHLKLLRE